MGKLPICVGKLPICVGKLPICVGKLPICVGKLPIFVGKLPKENNLYSHVNVDNTYHIGATSLPSLYFQVKHCSRCQHSEKVKTIAAELHPITAEAPWDVVGVDLIGPFTITESVYSYVKQTICFQSLYICLV